MPIAQAMWVHGHSLRVEYPDRLDSAVPVGSCMRLDGRAGTSNWLHLAVPTPVIVDGDRLRIDSLMLRFRTNGATVTDVHLYDGESKIATHAGLNLQPADWSFQRFDVPGTPDVRWGLGISFRVTFGAGTSRRIEVCSGGGDFLA